MSFPGEKPTVAKAVIHEWSMFDRFKRGILGLSAMWLLGGVSVFFPIVHWVLVPGFFVLGPLIGILRFTEQQELVSMHGSCPRCNLDREFALRVRFNGKRTFTCDGCGNLIEVELA
jgi:hypothetical protein